MKSSYVALAAVGLTLGGLWYAAGTGAGPQPTPAAAAEQPRVSAPATHDNLTVYFIHGPDTTADEKVVTLQEALDKNWVVVHETGNVNVLAVENLSDDHDLFLQSGDMVKGGKQDRIVSTDLLVPPKSGKVALPAHCVEQSRWRQRKATEAVDRFHSSDGQVCGKNLKAANLRQDQGGVWENVGVEQRKLSGNVGETVNCPTSPTSLQLALDNRAVRMKADAYVSALKDRAGCAPNVVGVVFVVNGQVSAAETYGSNLLFRKAWPKLLKSAAEEALADRTTGPCPAAPTGREVELFLANATKPDAPAADGPMSGGDPVTYSPPGVELRGRSVATRSAAVSGRGGRVNGEEEIYQAEGRQPAVQTEGRAPGSGGQPVQSGGARAGQFMIGGSVNSNAGLNPSDPDGQPRMQQAAMQVDNVVVGNNARGGRAVVNRIQGPGRGQPQPVTEPAGNGNRLEVIRAENGKVLYLESRSTAQPSAPVIHRSLITK